VTTATIVPQRLYTARTGKPALVHVPRIQFIMIDGTGDPNSSKEYKDAVEALYALSYTLKFAVKKQLGLQYKVGPLEGLWWARDMTEFDVQRKGDWHWTMMIAQPDAVTPERFAQACQEVQRKKGPPAVGKARLESFEEGPSAQILHVGPFTAEGPTIAVLHAFINGQGHRFDGRHDKHHEIYLSDPRKTPSEKWKTIIRQPYSR
jgi:hypothetical protein